MFVIILIVLVVWKRIISIRLESHDFSSVLKHCLLFDHLVVHLQLTDDALIRLLFYENYFLEVIIVTLSTSFIDQVYSLHLRGLGLDLEVVCADGHRSNCIFILKD